jgi:hypothetical protein
MPKETSDQNLHGIRLFVLGYLTCYPDAKDTLEGIRQWWMPNIQVQPRTDELQVTLEELVSSGWVLKTKLPGTPELYGLNRQRLDQILVALNSPTA